MAAEAPTVESDPLRQCLRAQRYGVLVRRPAQWRSRPDYETVIERASHAIDEGFALVPEGFASLPRTVPDEPGGAEDDVETAPLLLARCAVTNAQFQAFVDDGAYEALEWWPQDFWPHLIDLKDATGRSAPRHWRDGRHDRRLADHPVVGVCYFEAAAYARWAGYRLPTESEWQMAASWRIRSAAQVLRRYPWGDALDTRCCNVWATGRGRTAPVQDYPAGAAPNGVLQLVGNVWEWTESDFAPTDAAGGPIVGDTLMKSVRGGAFDTYFACQATSLFRTGLASLARAHNVGFRCAIDLDCRGESR